jgi:flagellar motor switch protein FliG
MAAESLPETVPDALPAAPSAPAKPPASAPPRADLPGLRKAAVLMAALGPERAANVLALLGEDDIEALSLEIAKMTPVGQETTDSVFHEVADAAAHGGSGTSGGVDFVRRAIERALGPERAVELLGRLSPREESRPFDFLRRVPPEQLASFLRSESPQTVALVLASLSSTLAANTLANLPERLQSDIGLRIARMGQTSASVVKQIEDVMRQKLTSVVHQEYSAAGGTKTLAEILNSADRTTERNVLDHLANADAPLADEVRSMLFVFEDIVTLDERAIQQVLREADQKDLVLALRGTPEQVKEVVLANMSERGATMLREEMEIQQPQRKRDVDEAQSRIVAVVRRLEEAGAIVIAGGDGEESEAVV